MLVCGVAQYTIGRADALLDPVSTSRSWPAKVIGWNTGNAAVVVGTLAAAPFVVDAGGLVLLSVLVGCLYELYRHPATAAPSGGLRVFRRLRHAYAAMLVLLAVSIPVGLLLAHLRHG